MNIYAEEFLGSNIEIIQSPDFSKKGIKGYIVNETKNTFIVCVNNKKKIIPKKGSLFKIGSFVLKGDLLAYRPEQRIKQYWRQ